MEETLGEWKLNRPQPGVIAEEDLFVTLSRGFCDWCECLTGRSSVDREAAAWLAKLHAAALSLAKPAPGDKAFEGGVPAVAAAATRSSIATVFQGFFYRAFFDADPYLADEPAIGDVADDLIDVYQDVLEGLVLHDAGHRSAAIRHWYETHAAHWGRHAVGALLALQCSRPLPQGERF